MTTKLPKRPMFTLELTDAHRKVLMKHVGQFATKQQAELEKAFPELTAYQSGSLLAQWIEEQERSKEAKAPPKSWPVEHIKLLVDGAIATDRAANGRTIRIQHLRDYLTKAGIPMSLLIALLISIPASAQECGMNIRQIADWSPCGQTITPADTIYAQAFGLTADVLRMVDTYVSGGTVNLQAAVFQVDVWMPSECSVEYRLTTKVRTCP